MAGKPFYEIIIKGEINSEETGVILAALSDHFLPNSIVLVKDINIPDLELGMFAAHLKDYRQVDGKTTIYICKDHICLVPVATAEEMLKIM